MAADAKNDGTIAMAKPTACFASHLFLVIFAPSVNSSVTAVVNSEICACADGRPVVGPIFRVGDAPNYAPNIRQIVQRAVAASRRSKGFSLSTESCGVNV